ncbi:MAG: YihY/virulence factor BrkB family protein [Acidimicrobiales bacterium]
MARLYGLGRQTYDEWRSDRTLRLGAGLAYYGLFTLLPFLSITAALAQPFFGSGEVEQFIADRLAAFGIDESEQAASAIGDGIDAGGTQTSLGLLGFVSLIFASTLLFFALSEAIRTIWRAPVRTGWRSRIRRRLFSFAMVLVTATGLVLVFAISALAGAAEALAADSPVLEGLADAIGGLASWVALAVMLTLLVRSLSPSYLTWRIGIVAGCVTSVVLVLGTSVIGWYLREFAGNSVAGAFGAVFAILTWVYLEAQIILAGVQLAKTMTLRAQGMESSELAARYEATGEVF